MEKNYTELVFVIDRSGSMQGLESDTIGGFNGMLKEQAGLEGGAVVTTVLFDDKLTLLHDRIDIRAVAPLTERDYTVRGTTALYDAIGFAAEKIRAVQKRTAEKWRAKKVLFVIITDGLENASRRYTASKIRRLIEHQKEKYSWEFLFLGANMDAALEAGNIGIDREFAHSWETTSVGTAMMYTSVSAIMTGMRTGHRNGK